MDKITAIPLEELNVLAAKLGFDLETTIKDYYITLLLFHLKDVKGLYFKGGTALNKIFLDHLRLSEDIDFTVVGNVKKKEKQIREIILKLDDFTEVKHDKKVKHFIRLIAHYNKEKIKGTIIIDLNSKAKLLLKPMNKELKHFYHEFIPKFNVHTIHINEMVAEKVCATANRFAPRDYFDLYNIIKLNLPVSMSLIKKKFKLDGKNFSPDLIFCKAKKVYRVWESDLLPLTTQKQSYIEVMKTLKKFFNFRNLPNQKKEI
jgi:predicted nucleotidyltransferase component of viral defense system